MLSVVQKNNTFTQKFTLSNPQKAKSAKTTKRAQRQNICTTQKKYHQRNLPSLIEREINNSTAI